SAGGGERSAPAALRGRLRGGRLEARLELAGSASRLAEAPAAGEFQLTGGELLLQGVNGQPQARPAASLRGKFHRSGDRVRLTDLELKARGLEATREIGIASLAAADPAGEGTGRAPIEGWQTLPATPPPPRSSARGWPPPPTA